MITPTTPSTADLAARCAERNRAREAAQAQPTAADLANLVQAARTADDKLFAATRRTVGHATERRLTADRDVALAALRDGHPDGPEAAEYLSDAFEQRRHLRRATEADSHTALRHRRNLLRALRDVQSLVGYVAHTEAEQANVQTAHRRLAACSNGSLAAALRDLAASQRTPEDTALLLLAADLVHAPAEAS